MVTYLDKEYQVIRYDKTNHVLIEKYRDYPPYYEFIPVMEAKITAMKHFMTGRLIANVELLSKIRQEDRVFASVDWLQKAIFLGFSYIAIAVPTDSIYSIVLQDLMDETNIRVKYFNQMKTAIEWTKNIE